MKIQIMAIEAMQRCNWESFCAMVGISEYSIAEGMPIDREFELTEEQAKQLGVIE